MGTLGLTEEVDKIMWSFIRAFCCIFKWHPAKVLETLEMDE